MAHWKAKIYTNPEAPTRDRVLDYMVNHSGMKNEFNTSQQQIGIDLGVATKTITRAFKALKQIGYVVEDPRHGRKYGKYMLNPLIYSYGDPNVRSELRRLVGQI